MAVQGSKRAVLVSIDPWTDDGCDNRPFNYSVRKIQAAALADPALAHWEFHILDLRSRDLEAFLAQAEALEPDLLGASAYVWSFPTFLELARRLKVSRPECAVVFGGPSARPEMFSLKPFVDGPASVDALVIGEGEESFREVLALGGDLSREALSRVPGLAVSTGTGWTLTPERAQPVLDTLASPYQLGLVGGTTGHLETFRGCPLSCTFCQWGDLSKANRVFSKEYLVRELEAFQRLNFGHAFIVDAALNLNPRAFRNLRDAEREVGFFRKAQLITEVYPSHVTNEHLEFLADIKDVTLGLGVQSLDRQVLDGVERPFDRARLERVVADLVTVAPRTIIELIVGLPGDNPDSFRRTLEGVFKLGAGVRIYRCLVLPNALMTRAPAHFQMEFDPYSLKMYSCHGWPREQFEGMLRELGDLVARTPGATRGDGGDEDTFTFPSAAVRSREASQQVSTGGRSAAAATTTTTTAASSAPEVRSRPAPPAPVPPALFEAFSHATEQATAGAWTLREVTRPQPERFVARMHLVAEATDLLVEMRAVQGATVRAFRVEQGVAYSYLNTQNLSAVTVRLFDALVQRVGPVVRGAFAASERDPEPPPSRPAPRRLPTLQGDGSQ